MTIYFSECKCFEYFQFISCLFVRKWDRSRKCTWLKFLHIVFWDASNYRYSELGSVPIDSDNWDCTVRLYSCKITAIGIFVISYHYSVFFCLNWRSGSNNAIRARANSECPWTYTIPAWYSTTRSNIFTIQKHHQ